MSGIGTSVISRAHVQSRVGTGLKDDVWMGPGQGLRAMCLEGASIPSPSVMGYESGWTRGFTDGQTISATAVGNPTTGKNVSRLRIKRPEVSTLGPLAPLDLGVP